MSAPELVWLQSDCDGRVEIDYPDDVPLREAFEVERGYIRDDIHKAALAHVNEDALLAAISEINHVAMYETDPAALNALTDAAARIRALSTSEPKGDA